MPPGRRGRRFAAIAARADQQQAYASVRWVRLVIAESQATAAAHAAEMAALIARADEQHRLKLRGDERDLYGAYSPAGVRELEDLRDQYTRGPAAPSQP
jgi:hypothetical protein